VTANQRPNLRVVLVDDLLPAPAATTLCGRPAVDWLLDTVAALDPDALTVVGGSDETVHRRVASRRALAALPTALAGTYVRLLVRCSAPLLRPATLGRAVRVVSDRDLPPSHLVVIESAREEPWWAEHADERRLPVLAVADLVGEALEDSVGQARADAVGQTLEDLLRQSLAGTPHPAGRVAAPGTTILADRAGSVVSLSLNDRVDLGRAENALYRRIATGWAAAGVFIEDLETIRIDAGVRIGTGARVRPHTELVGSTVVGRGSLVGPTTTIRDSRVGEDCTIRYAVCEGVEIGDQASIGPYCWLRSGTRLGTGTRAASVVGDGSTGVPASLD
jgi:bifunctional UDP-N-acetylglucosamine pyrophosphorylase/glucosamine-1-phosphate N-acetyltransferase